MQLTLGQAISRATEFAGGRLDWTPSDASFYVNRAAEYIARNADLQHRSLESSYATTIVSGVSRMQLPADYDMAVALSIGAATSGITQWTQLSKRDIGYADRAGGRFDTTTGRPTVYVEYGRVFDIVPVADSTYSIVLRYRRNYSDLTLSASTLDLDEQYHWPTVLKAVELLGASRSDAALEQAGRNRYIDYMSSMLPDQAKKYADQRGSQQPPPTAATTRTANL